MRQLRGVWLYPLYPHATCAKQHAGNICCSRIKYVTSCHVRLTRQHSKQHARLKMINFVPHAGAWSCGVIVFFSEIMQNIFQPPLKGSTMIALLTEHSCLVSVFKKWPLLHNIEASCRSKATVENNLGTPAAPAGCGREINSEFSAQR